MGRWLQFTGRGYHDGGQRAVKNTGTHVTRRHRSGAQVCRRCTFSTCARAVVVQFGAITLSGSPVSRLGDADDERRQAMRNSLADKLTVEAKGLADLKVEKAAVEGERRKVEADLGPVKYLATLLGRADEDVLRWFILVVALLLDPAAVRRVSGRPSCCEALLRLRRRRTLARLEAHGEATSSGWIHRQSQTSPALRRAQGLLTSTA